MEDRKARLAALSARAGRGGGCGGGGGDAARAPTNDNGKGTDGHDDTAAVAAPAAAPLAKDGADEPKKDDTQSSDNIEREEPAALSTKKALKFRNYSAGAAATGTEPARESGSPAAKKARRAADTKPSIGSTSASSNKNPPKSALELALEKAAASSSLAVPRAAMAGDVEDDDMGAVKAAAAALAPKKLNWDLKRDIQPKLDKLERRTQRAIVQLLQDRLGRDAANASSAEDLD
jgi:coiled-coil domain-containing protein 12